MLALLEIAADPVAPLGEDGLSGGVGREGDHQKVHELLLGGLGGPVGHPGAALVLHETDGRVDEVARDGIDVSPDVAHLRELGRLDLHERRVHEAREPPRDLGLPDACRTDHEDVLRHRVALKLGSEPLAPPAVAEGDRDRPLRPRLADDVAVELGYDLPRRKVLEEMGRHGSVSTRIASFV